LAINYPTSLDNFTNPSATSSLDSPSHSLQHSDANDALEALEAKVGIGASPAGSATSGQILTAQGGGTALWQGGAWISYTPTFTNFTLGNGTLDYAAYQQIGKTVIVRIRVVLGSTSSVSGNINISLPITSKNYTQTHVDLGGALINDSGSATYGAYFGFGNTTSVNLNTYDSAATHIRVALTSASVPMTWAVNDVFVGQFIYEAA
jgi:hypothetical protein